MKVTTIHYERKRSDQAYGNRSLSLTVELEEGEDVTLAIGNLTGLVRGRLDQDEREEDEERARREEEVRARYAAERAGRLQHHSVPPPDEDDEDDDEDDEDEEDDDEEEERGPVYRADEDIPW